MMTTAGGLPFRTEWPRRWQLDFRQQRLQLQQQRHPRLLMPKPTLQQSTEQVEVPFMMQPLPRRAADRVASRDVLALRCGQPRAASLPPRPVLARSIYPELGDILNHETLCWCLRCRQLLN
mmetsp:Transcript_46420/g.148255  ORF Transcript_46420/g.148255 Transcript_46420/m.148255 type:complete len:121 (-) Transcript_46420:164-526(-)